jgi:hypothetical protein
MRLKKPTGDEKCSRIQICPKLIGAIEMLVADEIECLLPRRNFRPRKLRSENFRRLRRPISKPYFESRPVVAGTFAR